MKADEPKESTMGEFRQNLIAINSFLRTILTVIVLAAAVIIGWLGYKAFIMDDLALKDTKKKLENAQKEVALRDEQIVSLNDDIKEKDARITKLDTSLRLLKVDHRVAEIEVVEQGVDPELDEPFTIVKFVELNDKGKPIDDAKEFKLAGDMIYVDYWVVKFDDKYVEEADIERSTSICLFRRIFGEHQRPKDGHSLDTVGDRPKAYGREGEISEFEQSIWSDFWNIANDPEVAAEKGIRAAHGQALSTKLLEGRKYRLNLRASDGLSITPAPESKPVSVR